MMGVGSLPAPRNAIQATSAPRITLQTRRKTLQIGIWVENVEAVSDKVGHASSGAVGQTLGVERTEKQAVEDIIDIAVIVFAEE